MLNRIVIAIIFLVSLSWIIYVALDISSEKNNYSPESLFNSKDGEVLIVIRPSEVNFADLDKFADAPSYDLMVSLNDTAYHMGYFSQKRDHLLLVKDDNWNSASIDLLFGNGRVSNSNSDEFKVGQYNARFHKTKLYLWKTNINNDNESKSEFIFDKKASAAIFRFSDAGKINNHSDIYFNDDGKINYITKDANIKQGSQVRDEVLFAGITTRNFDSYQFFERDYYATLDNDFKNGPMSKWQLNGFVKLIYQGETVIISDYIGGQDPILILNDLNQTQDSSVFSHTLIKGFPSQNSSYTIKYLEDAVVISESAAICDQVIADYRLGNTIALDKTINTKIFGQLPRAVSERMISSEESYAKMVYSGKLMETHTGHSEMTQQPKMASSISMSCGFDIADFAVLSGSGNVVALSNKGEIIAFRDQKPSWKADINDKPIGEIQLIDLHGTGESFILLNTKDEIHLWNLTGHYETGFPIKLETEVTNEVKFYRWKEKGYFFIANENQKVVQFDAKGRELNIISSGMNINRRIDVWASQRRLFAGFANSSLFKMYDVEKRKIHREFPISTESISLKVPNQLFQYSLSNNQLVKFDQKGIRTDFETYNRAKFHGIQIDHSSPVLIVQSSNQIRLINSEGVSFSEINLPFNEVEDVHVFTGDSGKTLIGVIDGLENNVYLYGTDGQKVVNKSLEGQSKIRLGSTNNQKRITTIVDQFVIQYFED
ncbi:MAG: hypothetical protein HRT57_07090 [Crocinitomicaceae bacterium]|nr:hypothetical protein [Crocinitomicaceae bacterium]